MAIRSPSRPVTLPALESGMRLTPEEFDRRYDLRPDIHKAELVKGRVYVTLSVRVDKHGEQTSILDIWAGGFALRDPGVRIASNSTVRLTADNRVQPDVMLWRTNDGSALLAPNGYLEGAPELAIEVTASSRDYDLGVKKDAYAEAGVQEYVVWLTEEERILWFELVEGTYVALQADADGITRSRVFPGLALDIPRLLSGDRTAVLG